MIEESNTREEIIKSIINTSLGELKGKDFELAVEYYLDGREDKEIEKLYKKIIDKNAQELFKELKSFSSDKDIEVEYEISNLVSFLSLSDLNIDKILTESPILKTLRAIPSIENVFILYTKDSEERFEELKEYLEGKNKEVIGKIVDIENINDSYNYIQSLVKAGEIDRSDTIMDSTLGFRMFGIALYKIAVERGINIIAWRDYQLPSYIKIGDVYLKSEKNNKRIPLLTKLILMQEPRFENAKIYRALTEELRKFNFKGASNYYYTLGLMDLKRLCQDLAEVFDLRNILELDSKKFYQNLENVLDRILHYDLEEEKNKEILKLILLKLLPLVNHSKLLKEINSFNIVKDDIDNYIDNLLKEDKNIKEKIYYLFALKYLEAKLEDEAIESSIVKNIVKKISKLNKRELEVDSIDEIIEEIFYEYNVEKLNTYEAEKLTRGKMEKRKEKMELSIKLKDIFELADNLIGEVEQPIEWNRSVLKIAKYNLEIDFLVEEQERGVNYLFTQKSSAEKIKPNAIAKPIIKLFTNSTEDLDEWKIEKIYNEKKEQGANTLSKNKSNLRNIIKFINDVINLKLMELGIKERDFIIIEDRDSNKKKKSLKRIYINDFFQDMRSE